MEAYLGILFVDGPDKFAIGEEIQAKAILMYWDNAPVGFYDGLVAGATFTIREGGTIVGDGVVEGD
ncbi:MAG: hypothetical protein AAFY15_13435 [Cyanobacteria bacterium J06648_11]